MFGQDGADTFILGRGDGNDIIADFVPGIDHLSVDGFGLDGFAAAMATGVQVGAHVMFRPAPGDSLVIYNVRLAQFHADDLLLG
jgi:Ca2+-binding RTX toxin-like protein